MLRVIFDTNIYGFLALETDAVEIEEKIAKDKDFVVYSYKPIRDELRAIPKVTKLSRETRVMLLNIYDRITGNHLLEQSARITHIAKKYYDLYRQSGGVYGWDTSIRIDFMIIACASIHGLDVVYSADSSTMLSRIAIKAYNHINLKENLRTPNFLRFEDLLKKFRGLI